MSIDVGTVDELSRKLDEVDYLADQGLATALFCAARLPQPLLLEGEAGVGKTEAAKALATALDTPLVRLQCYEGIDAAEALYEWNYPRQLLGIRVAEAAGKPLDSDDLFTPEYLVARPLLKAIEHAGPRPVVLLIDEVDRSDDEFEAFLFELMAESSVTIPELGTISAAFPPIVVLTSNRTRDLHDALKRRCLYHWIDYPDVERATAIVRRRVPAASADLAANVAAAVARLRNLDVQKPPGIAEAINWVAVLEILGIDVLDGTAVERTLGSVMKYREDLDLVSQRGFGWVATGARLEGGQHRGRPGNGCGNVRGPSAFRRNSGDAGAFRTLRRGHGSHRTGDLRRHLLGGQNHSGERPRPDRAVRSGLQSCLRRARRSGRGYAETPVRRRRVASLSQARPRLPTAGAEPSGPGGPVRTAPSETTWKVVPWP